MDEDFSLLPFSCPTEMRKQYSSIFQKQTKDKTVTQSEIHTNFYENSTGWFSRWLPHFSFTKSNVDLLTFRQISYFTRYPLPLGHRIPVSVCSRLEKKLEYSKFQLTIVSTTGQDKKPNDTRNPFPTAVKDWDGQVAASLGFATEAEAEWVNARLWSQMNLAALSAALLFCNLAENKLLATCPSLGPPIFQIMIYMLGCLCLV